MVLFQQSRTYAYGRSKLNWGWSVVSVCAFAGDIKNAKGTTVAIPIAMARMLQTTSLLSIFILVFHRFLFSQGGI